MARRRFAQLPWREPAARLGWNRHRLLVHINSTLPDGTLRDWISGKPLLCRLHLGCTGATDSSRIRRLCSSPSPCCPRPASRLANYFCSRLRHHMVVAKAINPSGSGNLSKLTCYRMVDSDKREEHEMCSHIRFARACVADLRRFASAVSS
jgi:hypothetical protein